MLVSLTYAAAAVRMSRRGVLAQQLNAIESLASVDTICVDKTGTLTEASLRVVEVIPAPGVSDEDLRQALGAARRELVVAQPHARGDRRCVPGASPSTPRRRGPVLQPPPVERGRARRREPVSWARPSGCRCGRSTRSPASASSRDGGCSPSRAGPATLPTEPGETPPPGLEPLGLVVLAEELRPNVQDTIAFLLGEGVEVKVLSGDNPQTVAAIAHDVGIPVHGVSATAREIPDDPEARRQFALERDGRRPDLPGGQAGDRARRCATRDATSRWSATASTTCRR